LPSETRGAHYRDGMRRIEGIDLARGLAVLGMVTAHVGPDTPLLEIADGRSAALFVVLSGVSIALMSGGARPVQGVRRVQARVTILARAFVLLGVGVALATLNVPVVVILPTYALLFAVAACLLRTPVRTLLIGAGLVVLVAPPLRVLLEGRITATWNGGGIVDLVLGEYYPALVWIGYLLVGLAVTRADLGAARTRTRLLVAGALATVLGYGSAAVLTRVLDAGPTLARLITSEPHSSSTPEVLGNIGVALLTLVACLWIAERWPRAVSPLAATGALALTAYIGHLLVIKAVGSQVVWQPTTAGWLAFLIVIVGGCWAWRSTVGRGPAEWALHRIAARAADTGVTERSAVDPT
jgi:uncharacterized membrane protein YeiB